VVYDAIWCCMMLYDGIWCYMMVNDAIWCYMKVYDAIWWYMVVYDAIWWYMMVYDAIWCYMMVYNAIWWYMMVNDGLWWYMMVYDDKCIILGSSKFSTFETQHMNLPSNRSYEWVPRAPGFRLGMRKHNILNTFYYVFSIQKLYIYINMYVDVCCMYRHKCWLYWCVLDNKYGKWGKRAKGILSDMFIHHYAVPDIYTYILPCMFWFSTL
jgi:hypothetical protein